VAPILTCAPYEALRSEIGALVGAGCGFAEIEDELAASELSGELSEEHAAALWLLAWSLRELPVKSPPPSWFGDSPVPDHHPLRPIEGNWRR
jgi:hypothetical protein